MELDKNMYMLNVPRYRYQLVINALVLIQAKLRLLRARIFYFFSVFYILSSPPAFLYSDARNLPTSLKPPSHFLSDAAPPLKL